MNRFAERIETMKIYYDKDANAAALREKRIAVIGYGSQGFAQSNNLRESGCNVTVGLRPDSPSFAKAEAAGLQVQPVATAAAEADIVMMLVPDELAHASAIGGGRAGIIETNFREETETDLFGEQAVLCGGLTALIKAGFETLVEAGYAPEMAYFECLHEMKLIVDLMYEGGISEMRYSISNTAQYGDMTRGPVVVNDETKRRMKDLLVDVQSGAFAREWMKENRNGRTRFRELEGQTREHQIERVGAQLREMMPWLAEGRLVDKAKN